MKKRIEASHKFNKEFNQPISIRKTTAYLIKASEPGYIQKAAMCAQRTFEAHQPPSQVSSMRELQSISE